MIDNDILLILMHRHKIFSNIFLNIIVYEFI